MNFMQSGAVAMLTDPIKRQGTVTPFTTPPANASPKPAASIPRVSAQEYGERMKRGAAAAAQTKGGAAPSAKAGTPKKSGHTQEVGAPRNRRTRQIRSVT